MPKATIQDVAAKAGVSISTVSRYMNGTKKLSEPARMRVEAAIRQLAYLPDANARSVRLRRSLTVGILVPDIENLYFSAVCKRVEALLYPRGHSLIMCNTGEDPAKERACLENLLQRRVDGLAVATTGGNAALLARAQALGVPLVLFDRAEKGVAADLVAEENAENARRCTLPLLEAGHTRIAFFSGPASWVSSERRKGFEQALREAGLSPDPALFAAHCPDYPAFSRCFSSFFCGAGAATAAFLSNPTLMRYFVMAAREQGVELPKEASFTGFGSWEYRALLPVAPTCLVQDGPAAAEAVARLLVRRMEECRQGDPPAAPRRVLIPCRFEPGGSVAPPRGL